MVRSCGLGAFRLLARGDDYECPSCRGKFARFVRRPPELQCPGCRSLARHRVMILYLENETGLFTEPSRLLHLAPEPSAHRRFRACPTIDYLTGDIAPGPLVGHQLDARELPFADESFDYVLCSHVLALIPEDLQVMREFSRVLRPGGQAFVQIPVDPRRDVTYEDASIDTPAGRKEHFGWEESVRLYGTDVAVRLAVEGLEGESIAYGDTLPADLQRRYVLHADSPLRGGDVHRFVKS
jgi:SAM-dependent methyltransferase